MNTLLMIFQSQIYYVDNPSVLLLEYFFLDAFSFTEDIVFIQ